jgi:hypothetical protein
MRIDHLPQHFMYVNREGAARAQYMCSLVQRSAGSCIDGFTAGRDERMISRATLLTEQVTNYTEYNTSEVQHYCQQYDTLA